MDQDTTSQSNNPQIQPPEADSPKANHPKRTKLLLLVGILIFATLVCYAWINRDTTSVAPKSNITSQNKASTFGATLASVDGTVEYIQSKDSSWDKAQGGESLNNLASVRTGANGRAIILLDDGSVARLDKSSEIHLSSLSSKGTELTLLNGQVYTRVVKSEKLPFIVVTASERFTALGTAFKTVAAGSKGTVEVYHSKVKAGSSGVEISEGNSYNTDTKKSSAIDLNALQVDEFVQWNKQKDISSEDFKGLLGILDDTPAPVAAPGSAQQPAPTGEAPGIRLSGTSTDKGAKLSWSLAGLTASQGFKIVRDSKDSTPSFGENSSLYISNASARSETWHDDTGGTYYYRVCIYREGTCTNYSNAVQVTSPKTVKEQIVSGGITLTLSGQILSWNLSTGTAPHGFKVVLSTSPGPTYPENSLMYIASGDRSVALPNKEPGTYYVRLCKYTNGTQELGCVDYSNQVEYSVAP